MALYLGKKRVAPSIQVKVPSMKAFFEAGGKCQGSTATSFEGVWKFEDTSNVTDMSYMFRSCSNITSIPPLDTSNVTSMKSTFEACSSLTSIPQLDMSNVNSVERMFTSCSKLVEIPHLNTSKVTNMRGFFFKL